MKGLIHLYCGDGKGKTTAALGLALRWTGYELPVTLVQFQKNTYSGELDALKHLPLITIVRAEDEITSFSWQLSAEEKAMRLKSNNHLLAQAMKSCEDGGRRLIILDELCSAMECGLIDTAAVLEIIRSKPDEVELVITGRNPSEELSGLADYITELCAVKHPMERGIPARKGVEY